MRFAFYALYRKAERVLKPRATHSANGDLLAAALATGVGSGGMYVLLLFTSLLWQAAGPGALFARACPGVDLFQLNALHALAFSLLHVLWSMLAFDAFRQLATRRGRLQFAGVCLSHVVARLVFFYLLFVL